MTNTGGVEEQRMQLANPTASQAEAAVMHAEISLLSLFLTFLRIGSIAFGGFTALIAVVDDIIVRKRRLMREEDMLEGISLAMMLPGPVAVNVVAFVGYRLRGGLGALVSACGVILPSFLLILGLSYFYLRYGEVPAVSSAFSGLVPAVTAIIINTAWGMSQKNIKTRPQFLIGLAAAVALGTLRGLYSTLLIILCSGLLGMALYRRSGQKSGAGESAAAGSLPAVRPASLVWFAASMLLLASFLLAFSLPLSWLPKDSYGRIFSTFSGMSLMLFGGGFVVIPLIQKIVVDGIHWVTQTEFTSAIAMGQVTPGPILISAAFIGYKVKGVPGALVATLAIFSPPALLMVNCSRMLDRIKSSAAIQAALGGVRPAVVGMIFSAAFMVGRGSLFHWGTLLIFLLALVSLMRFRLDVVWIIPAAGVLGMFIY
jgi:chromate transporter